jgi:glycosyltransferase involved in cell wall biosynthesis
MVSVVVPVYRSAGTLAQLVSRIRGVMTTANWPWEIILVDDSTPDDETRFELQQLGSSPDIRIVSLRRNRGQHLATVIGLSRARATFCVVMDADLQHPPESIPQLLAPLLEMPDLDAVVAAFAESRHGAFRRIGSRTVGRVIRWSNGLPKGFAFTSFLAMRSDTAAVVVAAGTKRLEPIIGLLLTEVTDRIMNVKVAHHSRVEGSSAWRPGRLLYLALQLFQSVLFTRRGLRSLAGVAITAGSLALGLALFYLVRFFSAGRPLTGFTTTVLLLLGFFALMSFLLSGLLEGTAGLRDAAWRDIASEIRADSWSHQ